MYCTYGVCACTIILLSALLYNFIRHYWYLPVKMRSFQRPAPRSNLTDPQNITEDERPQGCARGEEDQTGKKSELLRTIEEGVERRI